MCGELLPASFEVDHKVRFTDGGGDDRSNLHALCRTCHGSKTLAENHVATIARRVRNDAHVLNRWFHHDPHDFVPSRLVAATCRWKMRELEDRLRALGLRVGNTERVFPAVVWAYAWQAIGCNAPHEIIDAPVHGISLRTTSLPSNAVTRTGKKSPYFS